MQIEQFLEVIVKGFDGCFASPVEFFAFFRPKEFTAFVATIPMVLSFFALP